MRPNRVAEQCGVCPLLEPISAGILSIGPADWKIFQPFHLVIDDGTVAQRWADHTITSARQLTDYVLHDVGFDHQLFANGRNLVRQRPAPSMCDEHRHFGSTQNSLREASKDPFSQTAMAVTAHHQQSALLTSGGKQRFGGPSRIWLRGLDRDRKPVPA